MTQPFLLADPQHHGAPCTTLKHLKKKRGAGDSSGEESKGEIRGEIRGKIRGESRRVR
jgi:hypothetical protein